MIKSLILSLKYWVRVFKRAFRFAEELVGFKSILIAIFLALLLLLSVFFLGQLGVIPQNASFLGELINNVWIQVGTGLVGFTIIFLIMLLSFFYIPAKIYEEQGGFLENPFTIKVIPRDKEIEY